MSGRLAFRIARGTLNLMRERTASSAVMELRVGKPRGGRVIVVDDDVDFAETVRDIVEPEGYEVRLAHSAAEACEVVGEFDAQVALVDVRLGRDVGTRLIAELKALHPKLLCVMMTAYAALGTALMP